MEQHAKARQAARQATAQPCPEIMCISGLEDEKARAFSSMYDLSFTNERGLAGQLARLF